MFFKKMHEEIEDMKSQINITQDDYRDFNEKLLKVNQDTRELHDKYSSLSVADFGKSLAELNKKMDDIKERYDSLRRIIQFHDHTYITYVNDPPNGCYIYKDGLEYYIENLNLRGNTKFLAQKNPDLDYVVMATCDIDSNDEEVGHEEQYVIDLNARSFIRTE